eukprot:COSAG05_NODE_1514_length_4665_cov_54.657687_5_plen_77_part_00
MMLFCEFAHVDLQVRGTGTAVPRYEDQYLFTDRSIKVSQLLRSHFDGFVASFRTSAEDGDATATDTALPLAGVGGR